MVMLVSTGMSRRAEEGLSRLVQVASVDTLRTALGTAAGKWINADQQTLLFFATLREADCREVCELLIDVHGIDPAKSDRRGQTALHYLAKSKHVACVDCVDLLVSRGCAIDHVDGLLRQTPLFYAARWSTGAMVRRLVGHKADVNFKDVRGQTPLFWAESLEVCEELLRHRGDACVATDNSGASVAESHRKRSQHELSDYLTACAEVQRQRGRMTWSVQRAYGSQARSGPSAGAASSSSSSCGGGASAAGAGGDPGSATAGAGTSATAASGSSQQSYGNYASYATSLARERDVDALCELEDEFIEDHRRILGLDISEAELWSQIGLNPDAAHRRNTIRTIAQPTTRSGKVRHYTLKCLHMPPNPTCYTGAARARMYSVVGYVYFRICDGARKEEKATGTGTSAGASSPGAGDGNAASGSATATTDAGEVGGAVADDATAADKSAEEASAAGASSRVAATGHPPGHIVVSHLKVSKDHQRRGVATLLLAGMLQLAENERRGFVCSHLYLSVVARNSPAAALYRELGFVQTLKDDETEEVHMKLALPDGSDGVPSTSALRTAWLRRVRGSCGSIAHDTPGPPGKRRLLQDLLAAEMLPEDSVRPSKRRLERKTSATTGYPTPPSAVSTVTASTSEGAASATGGSSSEASSRSLARS